MRDEIFTGERKWYKLSDSGQVLLRLKSNQKESDRDKQESDEQPDTTEIPELESGKFAAQRRNQEGQGLKILTPNQMLSSLPITLAQLKARNNSEKLKNEIK